MPPDDTHTRIALLERDSEDMREALNSISKSLHRLVALEERHSETREAIGRAFKAIDGVDGRLAMIEQQVPQLVETRGWVLAMLGVVVTSVLAGIIALVVK